jgi:2-dehydropantoate 2-reductase
MRIMVFGTGGAGGFFGAQLANAGEHVVFIARGEHLRAIRENGLRVDMPTEQITISPAEVTDNPAQVRDVDAILLGVKAWQVRDVAQTLRPAIGPTTIVVPLQNGVDAASELSAILGPERVLVGLCGTLSWVTAPGRIRTMQGPNYIKFGEQDNRLSDRADRLLGAFKKTGVSAEIPLDIHRALWEKFLVITSFGGVGAVTRAAIGAMRTRPETRRMLERCMEEVLAVAHSKQIPLSPTIITDTMGIFDTLSPEGTTSMQRDIRDGKPSELEYWNGAVVRLGQEQSIPVPTHQFIYHSLLLQEQQARAATVLR